MLKFVICDDNKEFVNKVKLSVDRVMMPFNDEYKTIRFTECNENLIKIIKSEDPKIYILDVQMPRINGIELASRIRQYDYKSVIIMLTSFNDYKSDVFAKRVMALNYINKKNFEKPLEDTLKKALEIINGKRHIAVSFDGNTEIIPYENILYVKSSLNKKSILVCTNGEYPVNRPLYSIYEEMKPYFHRSHKSYIVNVTKIKTVNTAARTVTFKNGVTERLLSNRLAKEFTEYARNF